MSRKVDVYDSNVETFQNYAERLEQYFIANDVAEVKRAATLLSCIGAKIYQLLRSLTSPDLPSTKSYDELKAKPKKVHQLEEGTDFFSIDLQVHQSAVTTNKIWVYPLINNVRIRMELDTGSGLSLMTIRDFKAIFKKSPSLSTDRSIILNTYIGEKVRDNVLTRHYRAADRWAHGTITARNGPLSYSIQTSPGIVWRRHANQIVNTQPGATDPDLILPISLPKDTTRSQSAEPNPVTVPPPAPTVASTSASPSNLGTQPRRSGRITKPPVKLNL
ncbi:hypothetical protein RRG08_035645 [Elysia crispata]|uniref:Peptidase A2 domain-containing protein n=1 Tax=Elysia crispata TaxID=231223 RepID=A0AAE0YAG9_9GAST|nr:hypothetical protein RRG08_035645 [Elysia crispata]